jgi:sialic acid synthase SpsE
LGSGGLELSIRIGNKFIGEDQPVFIIAEAGVNHNGQFELAKEMVDVAARANVDAIKFQTFKTEDLVTKTAPKAEYQKGDNESESNQIDLLKKLELPLEKMQELKVYCEMNNLIFLSTPFDFGSADFLEELGVDAFKVGSGDFDNYFFLDHLIQKNKPILISSGMADIAEVRETVEFFKHYDFTQYALFQCTSSYPTPYESVNLRVIETYRTEFPNIIVGFSDHSPGDLLGAVAVGLGAKVIEKHFTLDQSMEGPDQKASLNPEQLDSYVAKIRIAEQALGSSEKFLTDVEKNVKEVARKSVV